MTEAVINRALLPIGEDGIGFTAFFKFFFGFWVVRIAVRMELHRKLAIGALDFLIGGSAGDPQHFVIIAFYVTGQNSFLSIFKLKNLIPKARVLAWGSCFFSLSRETDSSLSPRSSAE